MKKVVLSVDPGKMSGIASFVFEDKTPIIIESGEYDYTTYAAPIIRAIDHARQLECEIVVVCERFTINAQTIKNSQAPFSLEQIGILKYIMLINGLDPEKIVMQAPSDAKRMFPNEALKSLEYWHRGGEGHALDAIRHGLLWSVKSGWIPKALLK